MSHHQRVTFTCTKDEATRALWVQAMPSLGLGRLHSHQAPTDEDIEEAIQKPRIDYLRGKSIKISFEHWPEVDATGYDRDNGVGKMQEVASAIAASVATMTGGETKELNAAERRAVMREADASLHVSCRY